MNRDRAVFPVELYTVSDEICVNAPILEVFDFLAHPLNHVTMDGSSTVRGVVDGPSRLYLNARFTIAMHYFVPYRMSNLVVEFEEPYVIAWRHLGRHVWRYELREPQVGKTIIKESFCWSDAYSKLAYEVFRVPQRNLVSITQTLQRLQLILEGASSG